LIEGVFFHLTEIDTLPYQKQNNKQLTFSEFLFDLSNSNKEGFEEQAQQIEEQAKRSTSTSETEKKSSGKTVKEIVVLSEDDAMRQKKLDDFQNLEIMKHIRELQDNQIKMKAMIEETKSKTDKLEKEKEEAEEMAEEKKQELEEKKKELQKQKKNLNA
tara:strand:+ start:353 stop:829 length:477 start_codon:yes stop_codon:yes gene_type:complete